MKRSDGKGTGSVQTSDLKRGTTPGFGDIRIVLDPRGSTIVTEEEVRVGVGAVEGCV